MVVVDQWYVVEFTVEHVDVDWGPDVWIDAAEW